MRSSWNSMSPKSNATCSWKRRYTEKRTQIGRQYKEGGRDWSARSTCQVCKRPPEAERGVWSGILPHNLQKEPNLATP